MGRCSFGAGQLQRAVLVRDVAVAKAPWVALEESGALWHQHVKAATFEDFSIGTDDAPRGDPPLAVLSVLSNVSSQQRVVGSHALYALGDRSMHPGIAIPTGHAAAAGAQERRRRRVE